MSICCLIPCIVSYLRAWFVIGSITTMVMTVSELSITKGLAIKNDSLTSKLFCFFVSRWHILNASAGSVEIVGKRIFSYVKAVFH